MTAPARAALTLEQRRRLLAIARRALFDGLRQPARPLEPPSDPDLPARGGAFVTLLRGAELRGCVGRIHSTDPLAQTVHEMALRAARDDPRFEPVTLSELDQIRIEISVLSEAEPLRRLDRIRLGIDGLIVSSGPHRGLLLPQVATQNGWDRETFLSQTCVKAGLDPNAWRSECTRLKRFQAQVFSEGEAQR